MEKIEDYLNDVMPNIRYKGDGLYEIYSKTGTICYVGKAGAREFKKLLEGQTEKTFAMLKNIRGTYGSVPIAV